VKGGRFITHMKKLRQIESPLANFFGSGILALEEKLGPILWQFSPNFRWNPQRCRDFFKLLPRTTKEAAALGKQHDSKLKTRAWLKIERERPSAIVSKFVIPVFWSENSLTCCASSMLHSSSPTQRVNGRMRRI